MGRRRSSGPAYAGADYSNTNFDVTKDFESQFGGNDNKSSGLMGSVVNSMREKDKANAQARYNTLVGQSKSLMSGATGGGGPTVKSNEAQGLDFSALEKPPGQASKKGSLLTTNSMGSLFAR